MIATRFTQLVGCTVPLQQAGMGAVSPPELVAAVSEAGALGMLGTAHPGLSPASLAALIERVRALTSKPFGVNFIVAPQVIRHLDLRCIEIAARAARVVEYFYGEPDSRLVEMAHDGGALVSWQVGSAREAVAAAEAGCDFIVVQGVEAGGHVRGTVGTLSLLADVISSVGVPLVAAGGIGSARAVAAAIEAGAAGVRVGTRFVAATEAGAHSSYVAALIAADAKDTVLTEVFSRGFRDAPHRVLRSCTVEVEALQNETVGETTGLDGTRMPALRFFAFAADKSATGTIEAMSLFAGESVGAVKRIQSAADIVQELMGGLGA